jgi:hypothetical protein
MNRLVAWTISGALLAAAEGLMIANAQQSSAPALIAGDQPVTAEQVREKLQSPKDGRTSSSHAMADISKRPDP